MTIENRNARLSRKESGRKRTGPRRGDLRAVLGEEVIEALQPHPGRRMTETEFLEWVGEKTRAEWVDGEVIIMSPVNLEHDQLQGWLYRLLSEFVEFHDLGQVRGSELMVRLSKQPRRCLTDLFFVSHASEHLLKPAFFDGPPDLIVEIVSPDSMARDYREKFVNYEAGGVKEYWIVDPLSQTVEAYERVKGKFRQIPQKGGVIHSKVLRGLFIRPAWLWYRPFPKLAVALREIGIK
jgi:Uma2 family endonuclease